MANGGGHRREREEQRDRSASGSRVLYSVEKRRQPEFAHGARDSAHASGRAAFYGLVVTFTFSVLSGGIRSVTSVVFLGRITMCLLQSENWPLEYARRSYWPAS